MSWRHAGSALVGQEAGHTGRGKEGGRNRQLGSGQHSGRRLQAVFVSPHARFDRQHI